MNNRPQTEEELQTREAIGVIRASRFVRKYAHSHKAISMVTICDIHEEIFKDAWPEIARQYREENLKITHSKHLPPHHSEVVSLMAQKNAELQEKLKTLQIAEGIISGNHSSEDKMTEAFEMVVQVAAWLHHTITFVHPFREGNGRTARPSAKIKIKFGRHRKAVSLRRDKKKSIHHITACMRFGHSPNDLSHIA